VHSLHALPPTLFMTIATDAAMAVGLLILCAAALHDFAVRTVPNLYSVVLFAAGFVAAAIVFLVTFVFWRLRWMGGGDVKLLTAAAIFVAPLAVPMLVAATALAGGALALLFIAGGRLAKQPAATRPRAFVSRVLRCEQWRLRRGGPLPYAAAIAVGGVIATLHS
jgi:prepilin peptidase CpaA